MIAFTLGDHSCAIACFPGKPGYGPCFWWSNWWTCWRSLATGSNDTGGITGPLEDLDGFPYDAAAFVRVGSGSEPGSCMHEKPAFNGGRHRT